MAVGLVWIVLIGVAVAAQEQGANVKVEKSGKCERDRMLLRIILNVLEEIESIRSCCIISNTKLMNNNEATHKNKLILSFLLALTVLKR